MSYFSLHAYDADVWIREFRGLNQADPSMNPDIRFATEATNIETPHGVLQPMAAAVIQDGPVADSPRVETMAKFTRRWYTGTGSHDWYVCCAGGLLYQRQAGSDVPWVPIDLPVGVDAYSNSQWSWVTYEINEIGGTQLPNPRDILLMSNADDGMIMVIPPEIPTTWYDISSITWAVASDSTWQEIHSPRWWIIPVDTPYKFGVIERFAERIWGGAIKDEPDVLVYSAVFDPTDWRAYPYPDPEDPTTYIGEPEDGSGEIRQPSWDGDAFHALKRFGDYLLAFKKNRVWRIVGTNPGEYVFQEQFGGGTMFPNTVSVDVERVLMETDNGLLVYDGVSAKPYLREQVEQVWRTANRAAMDQMCAALFNNKYYVSFPTGDSAVNNAMLIYDLTEGSITFHDEYKVESFLPTDDVLFATSSDLPGKVMILRTDAWVTGQASGAATRWVTPWVDFGYKRIVKGGFDLYFLPEVQDTAVAITFSVQTEKKLKTKTYTVQPLTEEQKEAGKQNRGKRLHFSGTGRKFRIIIETASGVTAPWRLLGGIQMVVETDPD